MGKFFNKKKQEVEPIAEIISNKVMDIAKTLRQEGTGEILSDIDGSYTGMANENSHPVQDADDL